MARLWKLHIGLHKTATTHLQDSLEMAKNDLASAGILYISRLESREGRLVKLLRKEKLNAYLPNWAYRRRLESSLRTQFGPEAARMKTIMISDENLIGTSRDALWPGDRIYPRLETRLSGIQSISQENAVEIFVSIRSYESLLSSAYCQALRQGWGKKLPAPEVLKDNLLNSPPDWLDFLNRIKQHVPRAALKAWRFEDYITDRQSILQELIGYPFTSQAASRDTSQAAPSSTARLSKYCVAEILRINPHQSKRRYGKCLTEIISRHDKLNEDRFSLFNPDEKKILRSRYETTLSNLKREIPELLLEPQTPSETKVTKNIKP